MTLGKHILKYRKLKGLSQEELGKLLHVSRQTISKWESNQSSPDIQSCKEMAKIFDISLEEILGEKPKEDKKDHKKQNQRILIIALVSLLGISIIANTLLKKESLDQKTKISELEKRVEILQNQKDEDQQNVVITNEETSDLYSYLDYKLSNIKEYSYDLNIDLIPKKYQENTKVQIMMKTKKENYYDLQRQDNHFSGILHLPIEKVKNIQLIINNNGEIETQEIYLGLDFDDYLNDDCSGGLSLENYKEGKMKITFGGQIKKEASFNVNDKEYTLKRNVKYQDVKATIYINKKKKKTILLKQINKDNEWIEFENQYTYKGLKKGDQVLVKYSYKDENGELKKTKTKATLIGSYNEYYFSWE